MKKCGLFINTFFHDCDSQLSKNLTQNYSGHSIKKETDIWIDFEWKLPPEMRANQYKFFQKYHIPKRRYRLWYNLKSIWSSISKGYSTQQTWFYRLGFRSQPTSNQVILTLDTTWFLVFLLAFSIYSVTNCHFISFHIIWMVNIDTPPMFRHPLLRWDLLGHNCHQ